MLQAATKLTAVMIGPGSDKNTQYFRIHTTLYQKNVAEK